MKFVLALVVAASARKHPVRQEIVDDIRAKTASWQPMEVHENKLRHTDADKIHLRMGALDFDRVERKTLAEKAVDSFGFLGNLIGHSVDALKGWTDWDVPDDGEDTQEPKTDDPKPEPDAPEEAGEDQWGFDEVDDS